MTIGSIGSIGPGEASLARQLARAALAVGLGQFDADVIARAKICLPDFLSWGRDGLLHKTRSFLNPAMLYAQNRPQEFKTHVRCALINGATREEIPEVFVQVAIYCGVPAGVDAFRNAREVCAELDPKN